VAALPGHYTLLRCTLARCRCALGLFVVGLQDPVSIVYVPTYGDPFWEAAWRPGLLFMQSATLTASIVLRGSHRGSPTKRCFGSQRGGRPTVPPAASCDSTSPL
jgi:hypothetical protein